MIKGSPIFTPANLYGGQIWYDGSITSAGAIASWTDQFNVGGAATQGSGANQPVCTANQQGGKNTLLFSGTKALILPSTLYTIPNGPNTVVAVSNCTDVTAQRRIIQLADAGAGRLKLGYGAPDGGPNPVISYANNTNGLIGTVSATITNSNYTVSVGQYVGSNTSVEVNNSTPAVTANGNNVPSITSGAIGATAALAAPLIGGIAELILWNRALSTAEITALLYYLYQKWSITLP